MLRSNNTAASDWQDINVENVSISVDIQLLLLNRHLDWALGIEDVIKFLKLWQSH